MYVYNMYIYIYFVSAMAKYRAGELCVASKSLEKLNRRVRHLQQIQVIKNHEMLGCCPHDCTLLLNAFQMQQPLSVICHIGIAT